MVVVTLISIVVSPKIFITQKLPTAAHSMEISSKMSLEQSLAMMTQGLLSFSEFRHEIVIVQDNH